MCSAMPRRIAVIGSSCSPGCVSPGATGAGAGGFGGGAQRRGAARRCGERARALRPARLRGLRRAAVRARAAGAPDSMKSRMSFFVTRPPRPVPETCDGSTPCSDAMRATTGETNALAVLAARAAAAGAARRLGASAAGVSADDGASASWPPPRRRGLAAAPPARARSPAAGAAAPALPPIWRQLRPDLDGLAFLDEDLGQRPATPGSAPRCRPCRSRSRAAARRPRRARPPASASA